MRSRCKSLICFGNPICLAFILLVFFIWMLTQVRHESPHLEPSGLYWAEEGVSRNISHYVKLGENSTLLGPKKVCLPVPDLLLVVPSAVNNSDQRSTIRNTWGLWASENTDNNQSNPDRQNVYLNVKLIFMIGIDEHWKAGEIPSHLLDEQLYADDLVIENFIDTYNNLTLKSVYILKWVHRYCSGARYVMKVDDDMFINIPNVIKAIEESKQKDKLLLGSLICNAKPITNQWSKWYSPKIMFRAKRYPNYLSGTAYLMSGDLIEPLMHTALATPYFHLEDIFLTGICAKKLNVRPRDHPGFSFYKRPINPCIYKEIISGHEVPCSDLTKIWNLLHNPSSTYKCNLAKKTIFPPHDIKHCVWN